MRIRQVKPAFFKDARMAELTPDERLCYIGLWMLADDAGYLRWDPAEAALELYGYVARDERERAIADHLAVLIAAGRVVNLECGHLFLPTLTSHQRLAGASKRVETYQREHARCYAPTSPAGNRGDLTRPDPERSGTGTGGGTERDGSEPVSAPANGAAGSLTLAELGVPRPPDPLCDKVPSCGRAMHRVGDTNRWVCTNAPAHPTGTGALVAARA